MQGYLYAVAAGIFLASSASLPGQASTSPEVGDDFFSVSPKMSEQPSVSDPDFPIFPELGKAGSPMVVDYFYDYNCRECARSSKAILEMLESDFGAKFVFHPVGVSEETYRSSVVDSILYSADPNLFFLYHFSSMASLDAGGEFDEAAFLSDMPYLTGSFDEVWDDLDNLGDWDAAVILNNKTVSSLGISKLPAFVISGKYKYEGFEGADLLKEKIVEGMGRRLLEDGGAIQ